MAKLSKTQREVLTKLAQPNMILSHHLFAHWLDIEVYARGDSTNWRNTTRLTSPTFDALRRRKLIRREGPVVSNCSIYVITDAGREALREAADGDSE